MNSLLLILGLIAALLLVVIVYYAVRLVRVSRQTQDTASRLRALLRQQTLIDERMETLNNPSPAMTVPQASPLAPPLDSPELGFSDEVVKCDGVGLRAVSEDPVFLARVPNGEVQVQIGNRPPLPLKYVLDPRTKQTLQRVVSQATLSFGYSWSILASEGEEGSLSLRRLT